jgi:hypothetical protein
MKLGALIFVLAVGFSLIADAQSKSSGSKSASPQKAAATATTQMDHNLLTNGGIEAEGADDQHVPGWGSLEGLTGVAYGSVGGEWDWGLSGCPACGKRYLRLQFEDAVHELSVSQTLDVAPSADDIDKNTVSATISAYLGGYKESDTTATLMAAFQDASGRELGTIQTKAYDTKEIPKAERGSTGLLPCQTSGLVPSGTRKIVFTWRAYSTGDSGSYLGLGDNFSLVLNQPRPSQP